MAINHQALRRMVVVGGTKTSVSHLEVFRKEQRESFGRLAEIAMTELQRIIIERRRTERFKALRKARM